MTARTLDLGKVKMVNTINLSFFSFYAYVKTNLWKLNTDIGVVSMLRLHRSLLYKTPKLKFQTNVSRLCCNVKLVFDISFENQFNIALLTFGELSDPLRL